MPLFDLVAVVIVLAAVFSYLNFRVLKLPSTAIVGALSGACSRCSAFLCG